MINLGPFRLNPVGEYDTSKQYQLLDLVTYNGSSYVCINNDIIDGVSNIGIPPEGHERSEVYYQLCGKCGDKGDRAEVYDGFLELTDGNWDYKLSDKIIIKATEDLTTVSLNITNVYDGCCGMIITDMAYITLPENSDTSVNFNYITTSTNNLYFMYTFVYSNQLNKFIWNKNCVEGVIS